MILEERHKVPVDYNFRKGVVISPAVFEALPTVADGDAAVFAPGQTIKILIERDGRRRWHMIEIERAINGVDRVDYHASEVTIRAYQPE